MGQMLLKIRVYYKLRLYIIDCEFFPLPLLDIQNDGSTIFESIFYFCKNDRKGEQ